MPRRINKYNSDDSDEDFEPIVTSHWPLCELPQKMSGFLSVIAFFTLIISCYYPNTIYLTIIIMGLIYFMPKWFLRFPNKFGIITHRLKSIYDDPLNKTIAITIDDAPHDSLEEILDLLKEFKFKATFFVISGQVNDQNKQLLIRALKEGHQLCNHGSTDSIHAFKPSIVLDFYEIRKCDKFLTKLYEENNIKMPLKKLYRPGCGLFTPHMLNVVKKHKMQLVLGSVYPHDPVIKNSTINFHYIKAKLDDGDILIIHNRKWTPDLLRKLLPWLKDNHYNSVILDEFY